MATTRSTFKIPKKLAECADLMYETRARRLALNKQAEELEKQESLLRTHLIDNLPKSAAAGITGSVARATIVMKTFPTVKDWPALQRYIVKNAPKDPGVWALMGHTLGKKAAEELLASPQGKRLKFIEMQQAKSVSLEKV